MTFTYVEPDNSDVEAVRFLINDTDAANPLMQDEEISWLLNKWLDLYGTIEYVAAIAAETIAARYAREANSYSADGVSVSLANLGQQYRDLAASLRQMHKDLLVGGQPDVGGITPGEEPDPTVVPTDFGTGMHDNWDAGPQNYGNGPRPYYVAEQMPL